MTKTTFNAAPLIRTAVSTSLGSIDCGGPPSNGQRQDDRPLGLPLLQRLGCLQNRVGHLVPIGLDAPARAQSPERALQRADVVGEIDEPDRLRD